MFRFPGVLPAAKVIGLDCKAHQGQRKRCNKGIFKILWTENGAEGEVKIIKEEFRVATLFSH